MAYSRINYVGNGSTTQFSINFPLGFLSRADVTCHVIGEVDGLGNQLYRTLTWINDGLVSISGTAPATGATIVFERTVDKDTLVHDYSDGASIVEENLDQSNKQNIMLVHEVLDGRFGVLQNDINMGQFAVTNMADPVDEQDAVNLRYFEANNANANKLAAQAAQAAAELAEANAEIAETTSEASAIAAVAAQAAAEAASAAAGVSVAAINMPAPAGNGTKYVRQKVTEDGFEYRTAEETALDVGLPVPSGKALNYLRQSAGAAGLEYRTPAEVLTDIGAFTGAITVTAGEALAALDLCYFDDTNQRAGGLGKVYKVDTDAVSPVRIARRLCIPLVGIASGATGSAQVADGTVTGFTGLTSGAPVYASATAGALTQTPPAIPADGTQVAYRLVGFATSTATVWFAPDALTTFVKYKAAAAAAGVGTVTVETFTDSGNAERIARAYLAAPALYTQVTPSGSAFGNMTGNANLAGAFDGSTGGDTSSATGPYTGADGYVGKSFGSTQNVSRVVVSPSTGSGFCNDGASAQITLSVYTKTGAAPASIADGTLRATSTPFTDATTDRTIDFTTVSADHCWVVVHQSLGGSLGTYVSELKYYVAGVARNEPLTVGSETVNSAATDRVTAKFADTADANQDTMTTFLNRTGAVRDLIAEVTL